MSEHMEDTDTTPPAVQKKDKAKRGWSVSDKLKAGSILATFLISLLSLALSSRTQGTVAQADASRVEIAELPSNSNAGDQQNPWRAWQDPVSATTLYVGVRRRVEFKRPFTNIPRVGTALGVVNVYPMNERLMELGFVLPKEPPSSDPVALSYRTSDAPTVRRLRDFHVVTYADGEDEKGFWLKVGVGLPTNAGEFLVSVLQKRQPPVGIIQGMRGYGQLRGDSDLLTPDERWLVNFYTLVGSFNVTWTAQQ
jgi:hypothetical protein